MSESKSSNDFLKGKASQFISLVSGLAEKKIHQIVDRGAEQLSGIERGIQEAYHIIIDNIEDWSNRFTEKEPGEFINGDLVISPVDIVIPGNVIWLSSTERGREASSLIKAGEVFEFNEELIPYLKTPLFEADTKAAIEWARLDELDKLLKKGNYTDSMNVTDNGQVFSLRSLEHYIKQRKSEIKQQSQQEPENA